MTDTKREQSVEWLPSGKDGDIGTPESTTDPGIQADADYPSPGGWDSTTPTLTFNGIDALTGDYWTPPMSEPELERFLKSQKPAREEVEYLRRFIAEVEGRRRQRILSSRVDPKNLAATGWGVVFPEHCDSRIQRALTPLLNLRRGQICETDYYRVYSGAKAYKRGESAQKFLHNHGGSTGPVNPGKVPYYLLLVGSPDDIPYHLQSQLGVRHAVGRIHFDHLDDYRRYAESVVQAEKRWFDRRREVVFFSAANNDDDSTQRSQVELIVPLSRALSKRTSWRVRVVSGKHANYGQLGELLGGKKTPPLLFTTTHGLVFPPDRPEDQKRFQGALLCGSWPGPGSEVLRQHYFAAEDVLDDASLSGSICFHFACFSAGTPRYDNFSHQKEEPLHSGDSSFGTEIAPEAFISALPKRLLSLPERRGALAVVGHVDRAWTSSFSYLGEARESLVFEYVLEDLLDSFPLGHAMRYISRRYADLASDLTVVMDRSAPPAHPDTRTRARMWRAQTDARNFIILGDPAVRLPSARSMFMRIWRGGA